MYGSPYVYGDEDEAFRERLPHLRVPGSRSVLNDLAGREWKEVYASG